MKKSVLGLFIIFSMVILSFNVFALTCEETGGVICVGEEVCSVGFEPSDDSELCCLDECFIDDGSTEEFDYGSVTCEDLGGEICTGEQECSVGFTSSSDSELCCLDECFIDDGSTEEFDYGSVTCEELGGTICSSGGCSVGFTSSSDSELCCLDDCITEGGEIVDSDLGENEVGSGEETVSIKSAYYIIAGVVAVILIILIINYFRVKRGVVYEANTQENPIENKKL